MVALGSDGGVEGTLIGKAQTGVPEVQRGHARVH